MDCSQPGSSVHGISQARILEWIDISFSRGSSQPRDQSLVSYIGRRILYHWATWEATELIYNIMLVSGVLHSDSIFLNIIIHLKLLQNNGYNPCGIVAISNNISLLLTYFIHSSLYLLIPYPCLACPSFSLPVGIHSFVLCICESVSVLVYAFICFIS